MHIFDIMHYKVYGGQIVYKAILFLFLIVLNTPAVADSVNLASTQYVKDTCVTVSKTDAGVHTMSGDYSVTGTLSVPTPPLPPEE